MLASKQYFKGMAKDKTVSLREYARQFAAKGGNARAEKLSVEDRKRIARKGALARWGKVRKARKGA